MKKFIIINGAMGVGKTCLCKELNRTLAHSAWLDGDWCMMMNPMDFTEINQKMFLDNIYHLLNNYLTNPSFKYVLFSWVIPREEMMNYLIWKLADDDFKVIRITLLCEDNKLKERMLQAERDEATINKSMLYQEVFRRTDTIKVDTTELSVADTVDRVLKITKMQQ
ncbi:MAG: AAA family ATPase [Bacillota bacterium]|nr:AAA family ATPase [Bacillota bacterium]